MVLRKCKKHKQNDAFHCTQCVLEAQDRGAKAELEECLVELKDEINFSLDAEKLLQRYIEKRLKELE